MDTDNTKCSTRVILHSILEDIEIITKELLEYLGSLKSNRHDDINANQLIELLKEKDDQFQAMLNIAREQELLQKELNDLKSEVSRRDSDIKNLQSSLKDAEIKLSTALFEAKQKLEIIKQANANRISSEELIKYAHRISTSHATACPTNWTPGDPRRPYPTELEMRQVHFFNMDNPNRNNLENKPLPQMNGQPGLLSYQPSAEVQSIPMVGGSLDNGAQGLTQGMTHPNMTHATQGVNHTAQQHPIHSHEDIEPMSSDSSSSSSSDE